MVIIMKKVFFLLAVSALVLLTGCSSGTNQSAPEEDFISETVSKSQLTDMYCLLSDKFPSLYDTLGFDIKIPVDMHKYDSGKDSGIVILCDSTGKNIITLQTLKYGDYAKLYQEYLNTVSSTVFYYDNVRTYDDTELTVHDGEIVKAKRFDVKMKVDTFEKDAEERPITETKCLSYWFINKNVKEIKDRTAYIITIESTSPLQEREDYEKSDAGNAVSNLEIMSRIVTTLWPE